MARIEEEKVTQKLNLGIWKRLFKYLVDFKKGLLLLVFLMAIVAGVDSAMPLLTSYAIDNLVVKNTTDKLFWFCSSIFCNCNFSGYKRKDIYKASRKNRKLLGLSYKKIRL
ncbi:hypothetical protein [Clostridium sp. DMHC 10]|uniref:hypothetical protein n=1 Tax=Clostridium sp. DMHC 10 TaxID=747377 RepID=UPI000A657CEB|nr:hypothetical protein [Clostridium sp. DMHC 10]